MAVPVHGGAARLRPLDGRRVRRAGGRHLRRVRGAAVRTSTSSASVAMGRPAEVSVRPGTAAGRAHRWGAAGRRRRRRDGRAHPGDDARRRRGRAAGRPRRRHWCGPTRTSRPATRCSRPPAARCARRTSACSPPRASRRSTCTRRPRVGIVSTGDEVVPPRPPCCCRGQVRDATASALAGLVPDAGGVPVPLGDRRATTRRRWRWCCATPLARCDVVVVSAGSSVGARDETAGAVERLGAPGIVCHGLALRPGKPTLLAHCGRVPVLGLPGNPLSALVVFRLRRYPAGPPGRWPHAAAAGADARARLARPAGAVADRPARRRAGDGSTAGPTARWPTRSSVRRPCSRCSPRPTATSSCPRRPPACRAGAAVDVTLYR